MDPPCCPTTIHRQHLLLHLLLAALALSFYSSPALADGKFGRNNVYVQIDVFIVVFCP